MILSKGDKDMMILTRKTTKYLTPDFGKLSMRKKFVNKPNIELIASENVVSKAVMAAQGTVLTNKYTEGYLANVIMAVLIIIGRG